MIQIVDGVGVGAGKSYFVATRMLVTVADGGTVFYSDTFAVDREKFTALVESRFGLVMEPDQLIEIPEADMVRIHEVTAPGTEECPVLIVMDEAQGQLNARDWADNSKRPFFNWLCQSRHDDNDLIIISQSAQNIDKQIRRLCTEIVRCRNLAKSKVPLFGGWPFFIQIILDQDGTNSLDRRWVRHDKAIFGIYHSKSQRGKHKRLSGVIPRKQLKKATTNNKPMKIIFAIILIAAGVLVWAFINPPKGVTKLTDVQETTQKKESPAVMATLQKKEIPASAPATPVPLDIVEEQYRGFIADGKYVQLRTVEGWYVLGQISRHGLVEAVSQDAAKVRRVDGGTRFVVARNMQAASLVTPQATPPPKPQDVPQQVSDPELSEIYRRRAGEPPQTKTTPAMQKYRAEQGLRPETP